MAGGPWSVTQKLTPSLHTPNGLLPAPVEKDPSGLKSAALKSETVSAFLLATRMRWPSNPTETGEVTPLPVSVASTAPVEARTTETLLELKLGTQILVPSKAGFSAFDSTVTVWRTVPVASSFLILLGVPWASVTQMFVPSNTTPAGKAK